MEEMSPLWSLKNSSSREGKSMPKKQGSVTGGEAYICMYIYMYTYICMHVCMYTYIYILPKKQGSVTGGEACMCVVKRYVMYVCSKETCQRSRGP